MVPIGQPKDYNDFKSLALKGPGWNFIKAFDWTKNGRGAVLAL
jgi:hypothetical protein